MLGAHKMDMKKLIQKMTDIEAGKKMLNESVVDECGGSMPMAPQQQGNPVTVSVNFNASGAENVMELLNLLKNSGLQAAEGPSMPSQGMRMDMENFRNIVDAGDDMDNMDDIVDVNPKDDVKAKFSIGSKGDGAIKGMSKAESAEWSNGPNEIYADHQLMTKDLSGGLNRQKQSFKPAAKGDNPMAVKHESVDKDSLKIRLLQALEEKKSAKKPDADGDGVPDWADKNPGKDDNASNDAKDSKPKKGKVPPQFAKKKVDEVSNKTLKSYAKAASSSSHPRSASNLASKAAYALGKSPDDDFTAGERDDKKSAKRSNFIGKAIDRIAAKEASAPIRKNAAHEKEPTLPNKRAYDLEKAGEKKKPVSLKKAPWETNESTVSENRRFRLVVKSDNGNRAVKIYKDTDWEEYVVKHYENGQYLKDADYFDSDKQAAVDTAKHFLSQAKTQESSIAERSTGDYSAKKARAGKDIGKPGKQFSKIAKSAAKRYGSEEKGKKVAGAVLAKLRKK